MDRRQFLTRISAMAAAAVLDPEILLWKPTKRIFIPETVHIANWEEISRITLDRIMPKLLDNLFQESPLFIKLRTADNHDKAKAIDQDFHLVSCQVVPPQDIYVRQECSRIHIQSRESTFGQSDFKAYCQPPVYRGTQRSMYRM